MANEDRPLEIIKRFLKEKELKNFDWSHICNICWDIKTLGDPENHIVGTIDGHARPVCPGCINELSDPFTDPPMSIMKLLPNKRPFYGNSYPMCDYCRLRQGDWTTIFNGKACLLCSTCAANVEYCRSDDQGLQV